MTFRYLVITGVLAIACVVACRDSRERVSDESRAASLAPGDFVLVIDGKEPLQRWKVNAVTGDQVRVELFSTSRTFPQADVIPVRALEQQPKPEPGDLVVTLVVDAFWHIGVMQGHVQGEAYVLEVEHSKHYPTNDVYRVPDAFIDRFAKVRSAVELTDAARRRIPMRRAGWVPKEGETVVVRSPAGFERAEVSEVKAAAARLFPVDGRSDWRPLSALAPAKGRAAPRVGDVVARVGASDFGRVEAAEGDTVRGTFQSGTATTVAIDEIVVMADPAKVPLPQVASDALDLHQRSLLLRPLLVQLGVFHGHADPERRDVMLLVDPQGRPLAEARYALVGRLHERDDGFELSWAITDDAHPRVERPEGWTGPDDGKGVRAMLEQALRVGETAGADYVYRSYRTLHLLWDLTLRVEPNVACGAVDQHSAALVGLGEKCFGAEGTGR